MGKKVKYRDVVKREGPKQALRKGNKSRKGPHGPQRKRGFKAKPNFAQESSPAAKKPKPNEDKLVDCADSDEEEKDSFVDYMKLLRESFGDRLSKVSNEAISSESSSESEEEQHVAEEESNVDLAGGSNSDEDEITHFNDVESEEEAAQEDEMEESEDPFNKHVCHELHPSLLEALQESEAGLWEQHSKSWMRLGDLVVLIPKCYLKETEKRTLLDTTVYATPSPIPKRLDGSSTTQQLYIKAQIAPNLVQANKGLIGQNSLFTPLQQELFSIVNNYQDLYYPERTFDNAEQIRFVYCLHAVNHVLKTRTKVLHHNSKLAKKEDVPEEFRDQGLVRPKVLIVAPFKDSAHKIVNTIINIMFTEDKGNVIKKKRFVEDYTGGELYMPKKNPKPEDYERIFTGNSSDDFRIGITFTKKSLKLYSDFYSSDIIVASPLGLRTIIGAQGEPERDFDFLTSIELLVLDQTDVFFMQNWFHVSHIFDHLHLQPKALHGTDISRVRLWCLNLWAKFYRQTLIFSAIRLPHIDALFSNKCLNFAGKVQVANKTEEGHINQVYVPLQHVFRKFNASTAVEMIERRFEFFIRSVLPRQKDNAMKQTLIFIPSYYDYVRIRNYFKKEDLSFVQICEYSKDAKVARARDMFFHGDAHFLLYTERYHFYHRIRVKGIRHLESNMNKKVGSMDQMSVTVIYSRFDLHQVAAIVGSERAARLLSSERDEHMLLTEDN
ncbi:hypothetical protein D910_07347 [Dendroctonus ponderosae]